MKIDDVVENVWAKGFARYVLPLCGIIAVSGTGYAISKAVGVLEAHGDKIERINEHTRDISADVKGLASESRLRFETTGGHISELGKKLDNIDGRVRGLEIKVRP